MPPEQRARLLEELNNFLRSEAHYFLSSGTTGQPKWVEHTAETLNASAEALIQYLGLRHSDVFLRVLPKEHVGGFQVLNRSRLLGSRCVEMDPWNPTAAYELARAERVSFVSLVPTQLYDWVKLGRESPEALSYCLVGGAALDPGLKKEATQLGYPIFESWGMTEMGSAFAIRSPKDLAFKTLPGVSMKVGVDQELLVKGPMRCLRLLHWQDRWVESQWSAESWLSTGDRAQELPEGFQWLGRSDDVKKILGVAVDLSELERTWQQKFNHRMRLIARSHSRRGQEIALVLGDNELSIEELRRFNQSLPGPARAQILIVVEWDKVTTPLGKIMASHVFGKFPEIALEPKL